LQISAGYPFVGIISVGLSKKFLRYKNAQYSGVESLDFCHCPAGNKKSYPSGEKSGLLKNVGIL
jgi:hypothetical protein